jgi:hypothetical protein
MPTSSTALRGASGHLMCKGTHARQVQIWVDERLGPGAFDRIVAVHASAESRHAWQRLVVGGWYDAAVLISVVEDAAKAAGVSVEETAEAIARRNARADLKTVYRVFMKVLSPVPVLAFLPQIWRQYFRFGSVEILENRAGYVALGTEAIPTRFVPWVCGGWRGFLPETILAAGGHEPCISGPRINSTGGSTDGAWSVRVEATYELVTAPGRCDP